MTEPEHGEGCEMATCPNCGWPAWEHGLEGECPPPAPDRPGRCRVVMAGYAAKVVDRLLALRRSGVDDFPSAWHQAVTDHPPPFSWEDRNRRFGAAEELAIDFLRRACKDAWDDRDPCGVPNAGGLIEALGEMFDDDSAPAHRAPHRGLPWVS